MSRIVRIVTVMMVVLAACGGGDDDAGETTTVAAAGDSATTTTAAPPAGEGSTTAVPETTSTPAANPSDDFCRFAVEYAENVEFSPMGMSPADLEDTLRTTNDAINQAARVAPSEIKADVQLFADAYGGFIEVLDELGFNFLAFNDDLLDDPRLLALEDPALEEAGDRISAYCGLDDFIAAGPGAAGGTGGSGGGLPEVELPEDFPADLIPPGGKAIVSLDIAGSRSVTFDVESPADDVIAYYADVVGSPTIEMNEPKGALWTTEYQGTPLNLVVSETEPAITQVNIILG